MSVTDATKLFCFQSFQLKLNKIAKNTHPAALWPKVGTLAAVTSSENMAGAARDLLRPVQNNGKDFWQNTSGKPVLQFQYEKNALNTVADSEDAVNVCADLSSDPEPYGYVNATIGKRFREQFEITPDMFSNLPETMNERIALRVQQKIKSMMIRINDYFTAQIYAAVGTYVNGDDSGDLGQIRTIPTLNDEGRYNPLALTQVTKEYIRNGMQDARPIGVGGERLFDTLNAATKDAIGGFTVPVATPDMEVALYNDFRMDGVIGNGIQNLLTWMPGTIFMLEWMKNEGDYAANLEVRKSNVISYLGMLWDFTIYTDPCTLRTVVTIEKSTDLFIPIDAMYTNGFTKGVYDWKLDCGMTDCNFLTNS